MNGHIKSLQEQVDNLYANLNALRNETSSNATYSQTPERPTSHATLPPIDPVARYRPVSAL